MSEYIERDAVLKLAEDGYLAEFATDYARARKRIERISAADVQPVRRGRWTEEALASTAGGTYKVVRCSECMSQFPMYKTRYCPECGAKMEEAP